MSVGWRTIGMEYLGAFDKALPKLTKKLAGFCPGKVVNLMMDARWFHWPRGPKGHVGLHTTAIEQVSSHNYFWNWLNLAHKGFASWDFQKDGTLTYGVVCKAGVNRSVSCAYLLAECLRQHCDIVEVEHLSEYTWPHRKLCYSCGQCAGTTQRKVEAVKYAKFCWQSLQTNKW